MTADAAGKKTTERRGLASFVPILAWLPKYDRGWLGADVIAGLTLWGLVVPEAMAYAGIAVYLADVHTPVLEYSRQLGLVELVGEDHIFPTVDAAVSHIEAQREGDRETNG